MESEEYVGLLVKQRKDSEMTNLLKKKKKKNTW